MEASDIRKMIERALADGKLSRQESDDIKAAISADEKVTEEECEMFRQLQEKVWRGEVQLEN